MKKGTLNSKDKNNLIMAGVLVGMIALAVIFFNISRMLPIIYMFIGVEAIEILYAIPQVCKNYYKVFGSDAGAACWIPYYNVISVFKKPVAIAAIIAPIVTAIVGYLAMGPMFWATKGTINLFSEIQYRAYGWFVVCFVLWNVIVGIGYVQVIKAVNDLRADFMQTASSKAALADYILALLPLARCYSLLNLVNTLHFMINAGFEYGKDYSELELQEETEMEEE